MTSFFKTFRAELKQRLFSPSFAITTLLAALSYIASSIDELKFSWRSPNVDVLYFWDMAQNIGYFTSISILCCTAINCTTFLNDYKTNYYRHSVLRSGKLNYTLSKYLSCAVSGGLTLCCGLVLFIIIMSFKFPLVSDNSSYLELYIQSSDMIFTGELLQDGNYIGFFAVYILLAFLFGALWSAVGICVSVFITDKYVAAFSPYIIWYTLRGIIPATFRTENVFNGNYNMGGIGRSLLFAVVYFGAIIAVLGVVFCNKAARRCED